MKTAKNIIETILAGENEFTAVAELDVSVDRSPEAPYSWVDSHDPEVSIKFSLDIEYRGWGIKEISITPHPGEVTVNYQVPDESGKADGDYGEVYGDKMVDKEVTFDPSKLRRDDTLEKGLVTITKVDLQLNANGEVDYHRSYIEVSGTF